MGAQSEELLADTQSLLRLDVTSGIRMGFKVETFHFGSLGRSLRRLTNRSRSNGIFSLNMS